MYPKLVFNLYPFTENCYLPTAHVVQADRAGTLLHVLQKALPGTIASHGLTLSPAEERLLATVEALQPKHIEARFKGPKAKTAVPLAALLLDAATRPTVEAYLQRQIAAWLDEIVRHRLPLTLEVERRTLAKDVLLTFPESDLVPHLSFHKKPTGIEYRLQLGSETDKWTIRERAVVPLTNTDPAWLLVDHTLCRVPGINGNMVRPFRRKDVLQIPPDKERQYFRQFIAKNIRRSRVEAQGFRVQQTDVLQTTRLELVENILDRGWFLRPVFVYAGAEFPAGDRRDRITTLDIPPDNDPGDVTVHLICRQPALEKEQIAHLTRLGLADQGHRYHLPDGGVPGDYIDWLARHRDGLAAAGFQVVAPQIEDRLIAIVEAGLQLRSRAAGDWFDVQGELQVGDFRFPFRALWPYLRRSERYFPLPDGTFLLIPEAWFTRYADLAGALQERGEQLRLPKVLFTLLPAEIGSAAADFAEIDLNNADYQPTAELKAELRPYQLRGVQWLIGHYRQGFGACLADDMGLGKTLQTIALLLYAKSDDVRSGTGDAGQKTPDVQHPESEFQSPASAAQLDLFQSHRTELRLLNALIILPASLVFNWQQELAKFAPSLFVYVHAGAGRLKDARHLAGQDVVLTTYHTARQDLKLLEKVDWQFLILDESQQIKNHRSELSRMVRTLRGRHKISLSGTPIENSLADLWAQMDFINPATLGSFAQFREQFVVPIEKQNSALAKARLFQRVRPFFLRRTKEEVAPDLPALSEQVFFTELVPEQRKRYDALQSAKRNEILALFDDPKTRFAAIQALLRLRQLANHPVLMDADYTGGSGKFDDVLAQWDTVRRAGHKVLFFSTFEQHLQLFKRVFDTEKQPYAWLSGATSMADRAREVTRFQEDPSVQAFLITLTAGGVGLNLTAADYVFLLDPWWNPAREDQAIARAHRIGQQRPVTALRFIARNTIEEKIQVLQAHKRRLGAGLFDAGDALAGWSREELEMILG